MCRAIADGIHRLSGTELGSYFRVSRAAVPEAFPPLHGSFLAPAAADEVRSCGCVGLQQEEASTGVCAVMYRRSMHDLRRHMQRDKQPVQLLLRGPTGSGKSIALVSLVDWARSQGW